MNYQNTLTYLYNSVPMFQHVGGAAYKEGLENTQVLDKHFGHPHRSFRTIHVAGTNGKGSCSHTLAAILQEAGYRVGLYTSPHLVDFRERIRINGQPIPEKYVVDFVEKERDFFEPLHPSFFELTTAMAFRYFADEKVDVTVIEVGLGGRLDCTNIIHPDLCIITNISFDHVQFLGDTLAKIAGEKAGIIKAGIPVVIGETTPETKPVFLQKAAEEKAPIIFAEDTMKNDYPKMKTELQGLYQIKNTRTILAALPLLKEAGYRIDEQSIRSGFAHVCELTGLMGRWQKLQDAPHPDMRHRAQRRRHHIHCRATETTDLLPTSYYNRYGERQGHQRCALLASQRCHLLFHQSQRETRPPSRRAMQTRRTKRTARKLLSGCSCRCDCRTRKKPPGRFHLRRWQQLYCSGLISEPQYTQSPLRHLSVVPLRQLPNVPERLRQNKWHTPCSYRQTRTYPLKRR